MAEGRYQTTGWIEEIDVGDLVATFGRLRSGSAMKVLVRI